MSSVTEWTVWDDVQNNFRLVKADSQKRAIYKASRLGYYPRQTDDCRPRTGTKSKMSQEKFEEFMNKHFNGLELTRS